VLEDTRRLGELSWDTHTVGWFNMVRRVILGDAAREDHVLTDMLAALRSDANWAFLRPKRKRLRRRFFQRLNHHLARAEQGSLASVIADIPTTDRTAPSQQVPQWLFAFDAACIATFRALALLASHPAQAALAQEESREHTATSRLNLPYLRACILESLRLWPTTPMVLRESTRDTAWEAGIMPAKTNVMIFAPFFHRDDRRLPYADRFSPDLWLEGGDQAHKTWPLIPFSGGPAICPGQNLVLLLASTALAAILAHGPIRLLPPTVLDPQRPLPGTLNHFALRFTVEN
jgi:cytochrome P450